MGFYIVRTVTYSLYIYIYFCDILSLANSWQSYHSSFLYVYDGHPTYTRIPTYQSQHIKIGYIERSMKDSGHFYMTDSRNI